MSELSPEIAPQVVEATTQNAEEVAAALGRALDGELVVKPGEASTYTPGALAAGPGLAILFVLGEQGAAALIPEAGGLLPEWCREPDPTGESKLSTLSQELSMLLLPDDLMADRFEARWVENLGEALTTAEPIEGAGCLPIELAQGENLATLSLVWPLSKPTGLFPVTEATSSSQSTESDSTEEATESSSPAPDDNQTASVPSEKSSYAMPSDLEDLPANTRSLLHVEVPVSVNLGSKRQAIEEVIALGPGAIITLDKPCSGPLEVAIGDQRIAEGEAVKVGEKFGVRIRQMILPDEHFRTIKSIAAG